jgi:iron complex outermembrane receptor protein
MYKSNNTQLMRAVRACARAGGFGGAGGVALCAALLAGPAMAQSTQSDAPLEEVTVTGIRQSLSTSAELKRESSIVQDSISQEDLGKFPDANIAESLQRIPGVSIDRSNGEGKFVTVRGLGPQFNSVLFNGRTLASDNFGREFSFDLLAAELISGADVYKTSLGRLPEGGIGATINLHTAKPLDLDGFRSVVSAKGNYESNNEEVTPQVFGLISNTFADDTLGLLGSVSYQERNVSFDSVTTGGWLPNTDVGPAGNPIATDTYAPRNMDVGNSADERKRLGITLVGQYRPSDTLTLTLDGLYNNFESDSENRALGAWFEPSQYTSATIDGNRTVTSLTTNGNADMIVSNSLRDTTTKQIGFNTDWKPSDLIHVSFDATTSKAENDGVGTNYFTVIGIPTSYSYAVPTGDGMPSVFGFTPGALTNASLGRSHLAQREGEAASDRVREFRLDTEFMTEGGALKAVRLGAAHTARKLENQGGGTLNVGCLYCGYPTLVDPSLMRTFTLDGLSGGNVPHTFLTYDPDAYLAYLSSPASLAARDQAMGLAPGTSAAQLAEDSQGNGYNAVANPPDSVDEKTYSLYTELDVEGTIGGLDWFLNLGGRYTHTDLNSQSQQRQLLDLLLIPNDPTLFNAVYANNGEFVAVDQDASYDEFLPSLNLRVNLTPEVLLRIGASKTLTRPALDDLRPVTSYNTTRPASLESSGGNPNLKPYLSTNFDVSVEWYPTPTTTLSAAPFYKHVNDFIVTTIEQEIVPIENADDIPVGGVITGPNEATFSAARPRNAEAANIWGLELNLVHTFDNLPGWWSGFGTALNATFVDTNRDFGSISPEVRFAVVGLSDSKNATIFYEKYGFSARIAYNRREGFLYSIAEGSGSEPLFVRTYDQVDASVSYDVTDNATVFIEGTNILDNEYVRTARFDNQIRGYYEYGARFDAGFRLTF